MLVKHYKVFDANWDDYIEFDNYESAVRYCNDNNLSIIHIWSVIKEI